jgi:hypothetical protein
MQKPNKNQKGFLTLEIVLCLALASLFFFGTAALVFSNQQMQAGAQNDAKALELAQTGMEEAMAAGFSFTAPADVVDGDFTEHLETAWLADYAKEITSRASYVSFGRPGKTEITSLVADRQAGMGRDTCALGFSGDWQNPVMRGTISVGANNPATDVDAMAGKVYVTTNGSAAGLEDFFVIDAGDLDHPAKLKGINTGPGLNAVQIAGDYAFAANSSINGQLQIIKISDPADPAVMLNVKFTDAAGGGVGSSIFYYKDRVYIGTAKNDGPEFYVYDVQNPLAPQFKGEFEIGSGVNKIYVFGDYAYVATGDLNRLRILNISNPGQIAEVGDFSDVGGTAQSGESLAILGGKAVFGRAGGLPGAHIPELYWLDVSQPGSIQNLNSADVNMSVNDIFLRGGLAFLATNKTGGELQIYNLANDQLSYFASATLPGVATGIDCEGENFFLSLDGDPALQIISPGH